MGSPDAYLQVFQRDAQFQLWPGILAIQVNSSFRFLAIIQNAFVK